VYLNGNRASDSFILKGPDSSAICYWVSHNCAATWTYDARERLVQEKDGTGSTTVFTFDPQGNVTQESGTGGSVSRTYSGQRLQTQTQAGTTKRFLYDSLANQDCVVKSSYAGATCPTSGSPDLLEDQIYDYKSRLLGYRAYNGSGGLTKSSDYTSDPLDRPVKQVETISGSTTTYDFTYVGVTTALSKETLSGATNTTKRYAYDAFGNRATISAGANRYSYLYDPHGSISLLIDQNNATKESYGYRAYGASNAALSKTAAGFSAQTNPYQYTGKRLDSGSGTYDMGARRYSASTGRFLQVDQFHDALQNLELAADPLTQNRYALAGGNPVNFVEIDGHSLRPVVPDGGGGKAGNNRLSMNDSAAGSGGGGGGKGQGKATGGKGKGKGSNPAPPSKSPAGVRGASRVEDHRNDPDRPRGLVTPERYYGDKTPEQAKNALQAKYGKPRSERSDATTYYNPKSGRSYNVHTDPAHGKPHVDIRRRGKYPDRKVALRPRRGD
jgi:RHS repeat-associated protein